MRLVIVGLILLLCSCGRIAYDVEHRPGIGNVERIYFDNGGVARLEYPRWLERQKRHNTQAYEIDGACNSLCFYLAFHSPKSCYTENARLGVHLPTQFGVRTPASDRFADLLIENLVKPLATWVRANINNYTVFGGRDLTVVELREIYPEGECRKY